MPQHRLLVVEDDPDILELYEALLSDEGYLVTLAPDGRTAMARAADTPVAGVLLDYRLPDTSGMDLCRWLRAYLPRAVPIILITGDYTPMLRQQAMMAGAAAFLQKPFDPFALFALLAVHGLDTK